MRLDKFLKVSRLIKRRPVAKQAADAGRIKVNGRVADAAKQVAVGDELEIRLGPRTIFVRIESLAETVRKGEAGSLYTIMRTEDGRDDLLSF
ncbi:MAG TPA: RNA-binding S4 domain-containing protein [Candidatus Coatesbacteria bacterium]|nr:RNA-binding S4 domain-containing protein [Candidatus Coatesbacteria bacterium]